MLANCALGSFVAYNLGGCGVSGQCDLDQSRSPVRKPRAALGGSWHARGVRGLWSSGSPHGWGWLLSSIASDTTPPPPQDEGLCREEVAQPSAAAGRESGGGFPLPGCCACPGFAPFPSQPTLV